MKHSLSTLSSSRSWTGYAESHDHVAPSSSAGPAHIARRGAPAMLHLLVVVICLIGIAFLIAMVLTPAPEVGDSVAGATAVHR